ENSTVDEYADAFAHACKSRRKSCGGYSMVWQKQGASIMHAPCWKLKLKAMPYIIYSSWSTGTTLQQRFLSLMFPSKSYTGFGSSDDYLQYELQYLTKLKKYTEIGLEGCKTRANLNENNLCYNTGARQHVCSFCEVVSIQ
ncbi:hypothetical protein SARC_15148, partial [Sphaeroforma arctica JP610]